jgi:NOL1/NOP2/sun family putative RNA methylase
MELPAQFIQRMQGFLGDEFKAFAASYERERIRALRTGTLKISVPSFLSLTGARDGAEPELHLSPVPWTDNGFYYAEQDRPGKHPRHEAGLYYIQEPSAMAVAALSGTKPGERVLDLCAAPGGKTTELAAMMRGEGLLIANEIHPARARILSQNVERMGIRNAIVTSMDPDALAVRFPAFFDRIVVDAPCSGEGMFRKEEAALTGWSMDNIRLCAARQQTILEAACRMLCDGGTIVYSTCTFAPEENEGTVGAFLSKHGDFHVVPLSERLLEEPSGRYAGFAPARPDWDPASAPYPEISGAVRLWPHRLKGEGHFLCLLKKDGQTVPKICEDRIRRADHTALKLWAAFRDENLLPGPADGSGGPAGAEDDTCVISFGDELYRLPCPVSLDGLKVLRPGLDLGTIKKDRFEPAHALALTNRPDQSIRHFDLHSDDPETEQYLKGMSLPADSGLHGWVLVTVDGYSLGWGKAAGGMLKNHYPRGLRWL